MFHSPVLLAVFYFWIALIQTDGGDSLFYLCFLISLKIVPCLKYNKRTEWTLWFNCCGVGDITCKGTLCFQKNWKDHVSAWEWRKMNYVNESNWETDVAKFVQFVLSVSNTSWWPGAIFESTGTKLPSYKMACYHMKLEDVIRQIAFDARTSDYFEPVTRHRVTFSSQIYQGFFKEMLLLVVWI